MGNSRHSPFVIEAGEGFGFMGIGARLLVRARRQNRVRHGSSIGFTRIKPCLSMKLETGHFA